MDAGFPLGDGAQVLEPHVVAAAVQLRTQDLDAVFVPSGTADNAWVLTLTPLRPSELRFQILRPSGEVFFLRDIPLRAGTADDVAHTIALLAAEALTPLVPLKAGRHAPKLSPPAVPVSALAMPPTRERVWAVGVSPIAAVLLPRGFVAGGVSLLVERRRSGWLGNLDLRLWTRLAERGPDYRVTADQLSLSSSVGPTMRLGAFESWAAAGPTARVVRYGASGRDVAFDERVAYTWGVLVQAGIARTWGGVRWRLVGEARRYLNRHTYLLVDGTRQLNVGHTSVGAGVGVEVPL